MVYFQELLAILNEMSPYLLLGFFISGLLHVYVPRTIYQRFLGGGGLRSVVGASLLGIPLPLCSCGVIPTAVSLKKEGASDGAMVSFLVSTPQTGIDSVLATYGLLGLPFAIVRAAAAFVIAIFAGVMVNIFGVKKKPAPQKFKYLGTSQKEDCGCGCSSHPHSPAHIHSHKAKGRFTQALRYGLVDMIQDFGGWLVMGLLLAGAVTAFLPESVFAALKEHYFLNILLILVVSTPMYVCATGSIPIALTLMLMGVSPGAALVLMIAGPATNIASLIILRQQMGMQKTVIYLTTLILGAIAWALVVDFVMPSDWFSSLGSIGTECSHGHHHHGHDHAHELCSHGPIWWQTTTSTIFVALFMFAYYLKLTKKRKQH